MSHEIKTGAVLIRENTVLPTDLAFKSERCVPGWSIVTDLNGYALDRQIRKAGWTFFCIATEIRASVFGLDRQKMLRRAIERILKSPTFERFNSLEIAEVGSVGSVRFPAVRYVTVSAHPRHIQQSVFLSANDLPGLDVAKNDIPHEKTKFSGKPLRVADTTKQRGKHLEEMVQ